MPLLNSHACRLRDPKLFDKYRQGTRRSDGKPYTVLYGQRKDDRKWQEQSYRYSKTQWTASQALKMLGRSGFADQPKNGRGQDVRPSGAILDEASKVVEERQPSRLAVGLA